MYARCKICIMKPENFEETIKNKKQRNVVQEKTDVIEKKKT